MWQFSQFVFKIFLIFFVFTAYGVNPSEKKSLLALKDPVVYSSAEVGKSYSSIFSQAWLSVGRLYFEGRYNYEYSQTGSIYIGYPIAFGAESDIEFIPMIGALTGKLKGYAPAFTFTVTKPKLIVFSENQYVLSRTPAIGSYYYTWSSVLIRAYKPFFVGGCIQAEQASDHSSFIKIGPTLHYKLDKLTLEGYCYNFWKQGSTIAIGLEYDF